MDWCSQVGRSSSKSSGWLQDWCSHSLGLGLPWVLPLVGTCLGERLSYQSTKVGPLWIQKQSELQAWCWMVHQCLAAKYGWCHGVTGVWALQPNWLGFIQCPHSQHLLLDYPRECYLVHAYRCMDDWTMVPWRPRLTQEAWSQKCMKI